MTGVLDRDAIEQLIENGRAQQLTSAQTADQIVALAEDPTWVKAMTHPVRGEILSLLRRDGPLSPHPGHQAP